MALPNYSEFEKSNKTAYWDDAIESKIEYRPAIHIQRTWQYHAGVLGQIFS